jgi:archaemetzincin
MLLHARHVQVAFWRRFVVPAGAMLGGMSLLFFLMLPAQPASRMEPLRAEKLDAPYEALKPLHKPKRPPRPGDWLAEHTERGQSLETYKSTFHIAPKPGQRTIYIQPIGTFTEAQERVITLTVEYIERSFGLPVKRLEPLPSSAIPAEARRNNPDTGQPQILTTYVLRQVLAPSRPKEAVVFVAFTAEDLWPGRGWNFVFGEASIRDRVGVWSLSRHGDPSESDEAFRRSLRRTIGTATHEIGHMFSLPHCIAYECLMNGSNSQEESDAQPLEPCPVCLNKLCWNLGCNPKERYQRLIEFVTREHLTEDLPALQRALRVLDEQKASAKPKATSGP